MGKKVILIFLIFVGIFFRIYRINSLPAGLFIDEATIAVDAKGIAQNGMDEYGRRYPFAFEALSDYKLPGYIYPTAVAFKLFGPTLLSVKAIALIASIIGVFLIGYFAKILFPEKKYLPLYSMTIVALSPFHIHFSRIGYETMLATTLMTLYFISLYKSLTTGEKKWFLIGAISIIWSCWTYPGSKFEIPLITALVLMYILFAKPKTIKLKSAIKFCVFYVVVAAVSFLPGIINPTIDRRPLSYIAIGSDGTLRGIIFEKGRGMIGSWLWMFHLEFLFKKGDLFAYRHGTKEAGIFTGILVFPYIVGIISVIKNVSRENFSTIYILILLLVLGIPSALTSTTPYGTRFLPELIPFTVLIALGVDPVIEFVNRRRKFIRKAILTGAFLILLYQIILFAHIYFVHFKTTSLPEFPKPETDMALFVKNFRKSNPNTYIYFLNSESCRQWSHDDLSLWYFADLDNKEMVKWNNKFRTVRWAYEGGPFNAYDGAIIPTYSFDHMVLYPGYLDLSKIQKGSLLIKCGLHLKDIDPKNEKIVKVIYMYLNPERDPFYVITKKL